MPAMYYSQLICTLLHDSFVNYYQKLSRNKTLGWMPVMPWYNYYILFNFSLAVTLVCTYISCGTPFYIVIYWSVTR